MENEIHIWQAKIVDAQPYADQLIASLSMNEEERGKRLIDPVRRQHYWLAQGILRDVLSRYTHLSAKAIALQRGQHGKPYLEDTNLQFNLTHSNEMILVAVTTVGPIGIDVEFLERTHHFDDLVKRFFSQEEQQEYFLYSSEEERRLAFYRGWTRKEAYLKAIGLGLSYPLHQFSVSLQANEQHALLRIEQDTTVRSQWTLFSFEADKEYLASLAIESVTCNVKNYAWASSSSIFF